MADATYLWMACPDDPMPRKGATVGGRAVGDKLTATNEGGLKLGQAIPTSGKGDVARRDARAMGAISAPSTRMGARARARGVKSAPRRWAQVGTLSLTELNRRRREAGLPALKSLPAS